MSPFRGIDNGIKVAGDKMILCSTYIVYGIFVIMPPSWAIDGKN